MWMVLVILSYAALIRYAIGTV